LQEFYTLYSTGKTTNFFGGPTALRASTLKMEAIVFFKKLVNCTRIHCFPSQMKVIFHITLCSENTDGASCNNFRILFFWNMILHHRVMDPSIAKPYIQGLKCPRNFLNISNLADLDKSLSQNTWIQLHGSIVSYPS
jgi:hypothetical protein